MNISLPDIIYQQKKDIFLFLLVGLSTAIINFSLFAVCWHLLHLNHLIAVSIAYFSATTFHFFVNRSITFKSKNSSTLLQMSKYITLLIINYLITILILELSLLFIPSPYIGLCLALGVTVGVSYLTLRYWVFKKVVKY